MADFKFDPKLWDALDDDQRKLLNEAREQITASNKKDFEAEYQKRVEQVKQETEAKLTAEQQAKAERENALQSVPEKNRGFVNKLLDKGFTMDEIKQDQPELLEKEPEQVSGEFLTNQVNGEHDDTHTTPDGNVNAERDAEIKRFKERGFDPNNQQEAEHWAEYNKQGLI